MKGHTKRTKVKKVTQTESKLPIILMTAIIMVTILGVGFLLFREPNQSEQLQTSPYVQFSGDYSLQNVDQAATLSADGVQEIKMTADGSGFSPRTFVLKTGVPVRWIIDAVELTGCNNDVKVYAYNIYQQLTQGEKTTITFTPTQNGTIPFSCGMGMIRGNFIVVDDIDLANKQAVSAQIASVPEPTGGSCSMGGCGCGRR
ncbi:MAG TPA: cupredoxin domain-containing protein [Acidobacteriota bacterium]|nr:cupredoxin domain-containing protein [Acidobacteriota bacterium]